MLNLNKLIMRKLKLLYETTNGLAVKPTLNQDTGGMTSLPLRDGTQVTTPTQYSAVASNSPLLSCINFNRPTVHANLALIANEAHVLHQSTHYLVLMTYNPGMHEPCTGSAVER